YLAHERRFHWGSDAIDHGDARASAPGRGRAGRIVGHHPLLVVPVVRGPDVACGVNRHLGDHLDAAALKLVDDIPSLGAGGVTFRIVTCHQYYSTTIEVTEPYVVIAINRKTPRYVDRQTAKSLRRRLGAVGAGHLNDTGGLRGTDVREDI